MLDMVLCGWMFRLLACIFTQMDYHTSYRSLPKVVPDGESVISISRSSVLREESIKPQRKSGFSALDIFVPKLLS